VPNVYPPVINITNTPGAVILDNLYLYNVYDGIKVDGTAAAVGRIIFGNISGQPLHSGIFVNRALDVTSFNGHIHFWSFWSSDANVTNWTKANGTALEFQRVDGIGGGGSIFAINYLNTLLFSSSAAGVTTGASFGTVYADAGKYGVRVTGNSTGVQIANLYGSGSGVAGSQCYRDESAGSVVQIGNMRCFVSGLEAVKLTNVTTGSNLQIGNLIAQQYNDDNVGAHAISAASGPLYHSISVKAVQASTSNTASVVDTTSQIYDVTGYSQAFSPAVYGTTVAGTPAYGPTTSGTLVVNGAFVEANFRVTLTNWTGSQTGDTRVRLLSQYPAVAGVGGNPFVGSCDFSFFGFTTWKANSVVTGNVIAGTAEVQLGFLDTLTNGALSSLTPAAFGPSGSIVGHCSYPRL
jgi:hypothetical protein